MSLGPSIGYASSPLPSDLRFRSIEPRDLEQIKAIHLRLFPVQYSDEFFERAVRGIGLYRLPLMTSIAYYIKPKKRKPNLSLKKEAIPSAHADQDVGRASAARMGQADLRGEAYVMGRGHVARSISDDEGNYDDDEEEVIVGFIFSQLLGSERCAEDVGDAIALPIDGATNNSTTDFYGCYILTLGVLPEYRRGGLGQTLVRKAIESATNATPKCAVVIFTSIFIKKLHIQ
jgi:ribosomal protein S18 acetylase RimI-like enzyme